MDNFNVMANGTDVIATFVYGVLALILGQCDAADFVGVLLLPLNEVLLMIGSFAPLTLPKPTKTANETSVPESYNEVLIGATAALPPELPNASIARQMLGPIMKSAFHAFNKTPLAEIASTVLSNIKIRKAFVRSMTDPAFGPLLIRPFVQMLCFALAGDNAVEVDFLDPFGCEVDAVVAAFLNANKDLDALKLDERPFVVHDFLESLVDLILGEGKENEASALLTDEIKEIYAEKFEFDDMAAFPDLRDGLEAVLSSTRDYIEYFKEMVVPVPGVSLVHGLLRMCLSDRALAKTALEVALQSESLVSAVAQHFHDTYRLVSKEEAEGIIKDTVEHMLEKWKDNATVFAAMKNGYYEMAGKKFPVDFRGYNGLVKDIDAGVIDMEAIITYMKDSQFDCDIIERIAEFDIQAYARLKYAYVPMYKFIREYLVENAHKLAKTAGK